MLKINYLLQTQEAK